MRILSKWSRFNLSTWVPIGLLSGLNMLNSFAGAPGHCHFAIWQGAQASVPESATLIEAAGPVALQVPRNMRFKYVQIGSI